MALQPIAKVGGDQIQTWSLCSSKLEGTRPTGRIGWSRLWTDGQITTLLIMPSRYGRKGLNKTRCGRRGGVLIVYKQTTTAAELKPNTSHIALPHTDTVTPLSFTMLSEAKLPVRSNVLRRGGNCYLYTRTAAQRPTPAQQRSIQLTANSQQVPVTPSFIRYRVRPPNQPSEKFTSCYCYSNGSDRPRRRRLRRDRSVVFARWRQYAPHLIHGSFGPIRESAGPLPIPNGVLSVLLCGIVLPCQMNSRHLCACVEPWRSYERTRCQCHHV